MAREMTSQELVYNRKSQQYAQLYLAILNPAVVFSARVNGAPASDDEVAVLTIDGTSWGGSYTSAKRDMLGYVGASAGSYGKGMFRLRETLSGTPTSMKIGEISEIGWADDDYLTIMEEWPIGPLHLRIDDAGIVYMDYDLTYASQDSPHVYCDPIPVLGPTFIPVTLEGASVDVDFDAGDSWTPDGGGLTHVWALPTGGSIVSGGSSPQMVARFTASGVYRVSDSVTRDYGGGHVKVYEGSRYVRVFDAEDPPITQFSLNSCRGSWSGQGWGFSVTLYGEADLAQVRERALVCLFARDVYGGSVVSMGPIADREQIIAIGWISGETVVWDKEVGSVSFEVEGPKFWLDQMQGFPSGLKDVQTTPDEWVEWEDLTLKAGLYHWLRWRTTLPRLLDLYLTSDTRGIDIFNAAPGSLWNQVSSESKATIYAHPCFDRFGRLFVEVEPQLVPTGDRSSIPVVQTLLPEDLRRPLNLKRQTTPRVSLVDLTGVVFVDGEGEPLFSLAPGHIPRLLGKTEAVPRLALASQNQANELAGLFLGWRNNYYPNVPLALASNHRMLDVCPHQYLSFSLGAEDTIRGLPLSLTLIPRKISFDHNAGTGAMLTTVEAEAVTTDVAAIDGDVPPEPPPPEPPPPVDDDWDPWPQPDEEWPTIAYVGTKDNGVYYTETFGGPSDPQPVWSTVNSGLPDIAGDYKVQQLLIDPVDRVDYQYCMIDTATGVAIWRRVDQAVWAESISAADVVDLVGAGFYLAFMAIDPSNPGYLYGLVRHDQSDNRRGRVIKSTNYGADWTDGGEVYQKAFRPNTTPTGFKVNGLNLYVGVNEGPSVSLYYSGDGGGSWDDIVIAASSWKARVHVNPLTPAYCYTNDAPHNINDADLLTVTNAGVKTLILADIAPWSEISSCMWFSALDALEQRIVQNNDESSQWDIAKIYITSDGWATRTPYTLTPHNISQIATWVSSTVIGEDWIVYGAQDTDEENGSPNHPHIILCADASIDINNPVGRAGTNAATSPYTGAIPFDCGGLAMDGIQVVG